MATKQRKTRMTRKELLTGLRQTDSVIQRLLLRTITTTINPDEAVATEAHLQMMPSEVVGK
jgi:hypothetical protein